MAKEKAKEEVPAHQRVYNAASTMCNSLDTVVPSAMSVEQTKFNEKLKSAIGDVDKYVAERLKYKSVNDLCHYFGKEQIDAIATAIWQKETSGDSIIIADQTGVGKGRVAAGLIRYAILYLEKAPIFFTEKAHLISDIYRDLINIGLDMGVPEKCRVKTTIRGKESYTRDEIVDFIYDDLDNNEELRVDYDFDENEITEGSGKEVTTSDIKKYLNNVDNEHILEEVIELYQQHFLEEGGEMVKIGYVKNAKYEQCTLEGLKNGMIHVKPFLPNDSQKIKDPEGNILYTADKKGQKAAYENQSIPNDFKLVALAYSQIQKPYATNKKTGKFELTPKARLLRRHAIDNVVILDESHNAAGIDNSGKKSNTAEMMFPIVKDSFMTTFLSATYAKKENNMPLYSLTTAIREAGLSDENLIDAFKTGGNSLQEAVSADLVRNGELLRREKVVKGTTEYDQEPETTETGKTQISRIDHVASLWKEVIEFGSVVQESVKIERDLAGISDKDMIKFAGGVSRHTFMLFNFFLLGLKVNQTAKKAIRSMQEGKKPVIAIGNTMESIYDKIRKTYTLNDWSDSDNYNMGDSIDNDFNRVLCVYLQSTLKLKIKSEKVDDQGNEQVEYNIFNISTPESRKKVDKLILNATGATSSFATDLISRIEDKYKEVLTQILGSPTSIPISPIDMIMYKVQKAGFTIEEITGRKRKTEVIEEDGMLKYVLGERKIRKTEEVVLDFNQNKTDALIINQSGATGLSMHAIPNDVVTEIPTTPPISLENTKELKKRCMIVTQMELDVNKEVQKLGRINRTGQYYPPEFIYLISAIPSEARLSAMMEKKLRTLNANVSSNQEQMSSQVSFDDFFSREAAEPCMKTLTDMGRLDLVGRVNKKDGVIKSKEDIYNLTKLLYFENYSTQKEFYDSFSKNLSETIEMLKSTGQYKGKLISKDYYAKSLNVYPFFLGDNNARTSFGRHVFIDKSEVTIEDEKNYERSVRDRIIGNLNIVFKDTHNSVAFLETSDYALKIYEYIEVCRQIFKDRKDDAERVAAKERDEINVEILTIDQKLKDFGLLDEAMRIKDEIYELESKNTELISEVTSIMSSGDADAMSKIQEKTSQSQQIKASLEELNEKIKKPEYIEALENQYEYKRVKRERVYNENKLEQIDESLKKIISEVEYKEQVLKYTEEYLPMIGEVFEYTVREESYRWDDDADGMRYTYEDVSSNKAVLHGVSIPVLEEPTTYDDIRQYVTLGQVDLKLTEIISTETTNLSRLHDRINDQAKEEGKEHSFFLKRQGFEYQDNWNEIVQKKDTRRLEEKYFLTGSLLKGFVAAFNNGYTGSMVKYNTSENKLRIGIELSEKSTDAISNRYEDELSNSYPIYFDVNESNLDYFVKKYLWYAYKANRDESERGTNINKFENYLSTGTVDNSIIFEMSSSSKSISALWFRDSRVGSIYDLDTVTPFGSQDELYKNLDVYMTFTDSRQADGFYRLAKLSAKKYKLEAPTIEGFRDSNMKLTTRTPKVIVDEFESVYNIKRKYKITGGATIFEDFFPTNVIKYEQKVSETGGSSWDILYEYTYAVRMSTEVFDALIDHLNSMSKRLTLCTSSQWYEKSGANFIMEQHDDDLQIPSVTEDAEVEFVSPLTDEVKEKVDGLIDDLLTAIADGITEYV